MTNIVQKSAQPFAKLALQLVDIDIANLVPAARRYLRATALMRGSSVAQRSGAYFSPSWTAFQADRGRDFSVIVDGVSG